MVNEDNKMPNMGLWLPGRNKKVSIPISKNGLAVWPMIGESDKFSRYGTLNNLIKDTNHLY